MSGKGLMGRAALSSSGGAAGGEGGARPPRRLLRDRRELVLSNVFVTMQLAEKNTNHLDKTKLMGVVSNTRKWRHGKPVAAAWLENPLIRGQGALVMQGTYEEKELAAGGQGRPVRCRYKAHISSGPGNKHSVALLMFKPSKPRGKTLHDFVARLQQDTEYACVHFITDIRGLLARGDLTFANFTLAARKDIRTNLAQRLVAEYAENLPQHVHRQNGFKLAQKRVVAKVAAAKGFAVSLEKMALHTDARDLRKFRITYEPEVDPALQVKFEASQFGEPVTAMVYSNGLVVYSSADVRFILQADELLRTGRAPGTSRGGGAGQGSQGNQSNSSSSTTTSTSSSSSQGSMLGSVSGGTVAVDRGEEYYPLEGTREFARTRLPLFARYRHPAAPQEPEPAAAAGP